MVRKMVMLVVIFAGIIQFLDSDEALANYVARRVKEITPQEGLIESASEIPYSIFGSEEIKRWLLEDMLSKFLENEKFRGRIKPNKEKQILADLAASETESLSTLAWLLRSKGQVDVIYFYALIEAMFDYVVDSFDIRLFEGESRDIKYKIGKSVSEDVENRLMIPQELREKLITPLSKQELPESLQDVKREFIQATEGKSKIISTGIIKDTLDKLEETVNGRRRNMTSYVKHLREEISKMMKELGRNELLEIKYIIVANNEGKISKDKIEKAMVLVNKIRDEAVIDVRVDIRFELKECYSHFDAELLEILDKDGLKREKVVSEIEKGLNLFSSALVSLESGLSELLK